MAIGDRDGEVLLEVSAEPDMSSILPQSELLRKISPSSAVLRRERVPMARLESAAQPYLAPEDRIFLKIDTQGFEPQVLAGAGGLMARLCGLQLEMSLVPCYEGEVGFRAMLDRLAAAGFEPCLFIPGYFERKLGRQLQLDGVFMRAPPASRRTSALTPAPADPTSPPDTNGERGTASCCCRPISPRRWRRFTGTAGLSSPARWCCRSCSACCGRLCSGWACWSRPGWRTSFATRRG